MEYTYQSSLVCAGVLLKQTEFKYQAVQEKTKKKLSGVTAWKARMSERNTSTRIFTQETEFCITWETKSQHWSFKLHPHIMYWNVCQVRNVLSFHDQVDLLPKPERPLLLAKHNQSVTVTCLFLLQWWHWGRDCGPALHRSQWEGRAGASPAHRTGNFKSTACSFESDKPCYLYTW